MPFWTGDTANGPSTGPSTVRVDPDKVLALKADLQLIHDEIYEFLNTNAGAMVMRPPGADPVSSDTANAFNQNVQAAVDASWGYLDEVKSVLDALDQAAKTYNLVEDTNTQTFRQGIQ